MARKTVRVTILQEGGMCAIPVPFDPREVFGRVRAPVQVTLNGYTYSSTIASMDGRTFVPLRRSNREAAGVEGGQRVEVELRLDTTQREVRVPSDLKKALKRAPGAWECWSKLSYSHRREHAQAIEEARKPETRARRIEKAVGACAPGQSR